MMKKFEKYWKQTLYTLIVTLQTFNVGRGVGWPMPASLYFQTNHTKRLVFPGESEEIVPAFDSLQIAVISAAGPFSGFLYSLVAIFVKVNLSPKYKILLISINEMISWFLYLMGDQTAIFFTIGRMAFGISHGNLLQVPLYIEEITEAEIRGGLVCLTDCLLNAGLMIGFIIGSNALFANSLWINLCLSLASVVTVLFLPESPVWLMAQNKRIEARENLKRLRIKDHDFENELNNIEVYLNNKKEYSLKESIQELRNKSSSLKSFMIIITLFIIITTSGVAITNYFSIEILRKAGSSFSEFDTIILTGVLSLLGSICACLFSDKFGRRPLLLTSNLMVIICLGLLALYTSELVDINLIPKIAIPTHVFAMNVGLGPIPYVMMSELLPPPIRQFGSNISLFVLCGLFSLVLFTFPLLIQAIGLSLSLTLYTIFSICSCIFIWFFVPETKNIPRHLMERTIYKDYIEVSKEETMRLD